MMILLREILSILQLLVAHLFVGVVGIGLAIRLLVHLPRQQLHRLRQRDLRADEPRCPHCRYIIKGTASTCCPECGGNLTVGLLVPGPLPPLGPRVKMMLWALTWLPAIGLAGYFALGALLPFCNRSQGVLLLRPPHSPSADRIIQISASGRGNAMHTKAERVSMEGPMRKSVQRNGLTTEYIDIGATQPGLHPQPQRVVTFEVHNPVELEAMKSHVGIIWPDIPLADQRAIGADLVRIVGESRAGTTFEYIKLNTLQVEFHLLKVHFDPPMSYTLSYVIAFVVLSICCLIVRLRVASKATPRRGSASGVGHTLDSP